MFSFSAHLLLHPSCKLATTNPKLTQDSSYECQPILIPTVWTHGQLRALHYYVRLMPRPIDHHAKQFRPHACPYIPHRLVFQAPKLVSPAAHGRFRRPGACRSVGVSPRSGLAPFFRSGRAAVGGSGCVCVDPGPSFNTQRDFVPTHAFRPAAAGGSPAGAWPEQHRRRTRNLALAGRCRSPRLRSWEGRRSPAGTCVSPHHAPSACSLSSTLPPL